MIFLNLWELYADALFTNGSFNELTVFWISSSLPPREHSRTPILSQKFCSSLLLPLLGQAMWYPPLGQLHGEPIREGALSLQHTGAAQSSCWELYQAGGISLGFLGSKGRAFQRERFTKGTRLWIWHRFKVCYILTWGAQAAFLVLSVEPSQMWQLLCHGVLWIIFLLHDLMSKELLNALDPR